MAELGINIYVGSFISNSIVDPKYSLRDSGGKEVQKGSVLSPFIP
jgi:hypothetical protein